MALAKEKPLFAAPTGYEDDFYAWTVEQAELLRLKRFAEIDLTHLVDEVESMGISDRRALRSSYRVLIAHLLKWQFQPQMRSKSWLETIDRERDNIEDVERDSPSLARRADELVKEAYGGARRFAMRETGLAGKVFPEACPYSTGDLRDFDYLPGPVEPAVRRTEG